MFTIYSASAGSGKTYTLTKEYLKLALSGGNADGVPASVSESKSGFTGTYFRHILAITFTNAAAAELKNRVLVELEAMARTVVLEGAESQVISPMLADIVTELTGHKPGTDAFKLALALVSNRAQTLFQAILHGYSDFAITTIDSFTQRLVMAFTDELGLPFAFDVEMDTDQVLEVAVDNLIERVGTEDMTEITEIFHQIMAETTREGHSWHQVAKTLQDFGHVLTSDQHYTAVGRLAELSATQIRAIRKQLRTFRETVHVQMQTHAKTALAHMARAGVNVDDFKLKKGGIAGYFEAVAGGETGKEVNATSLKAIENDEWYVKTMPLGTKVAIDGIKDELIACFRAIQDEQAESGKMLTLVNAVDPQLQKMALLQQIRTEFVELLRKDGRVHISEFNQRIKAIVESEPVPFLYERLGSRYNHILIDEFQDTSRLQFANLMPLIENALGAGHMNLVVGDGKQSIYRWRGGDKDQIVALHRRQLTELQRIHGSESWTAERIGTLGGNIESQTLTVNYRSARPIVAFNNNLFSFLADAHSAANQHVEAVYDAAKAFRQQPRPNAPDEAHIQFDFLSKDDIPLPASVDSEMVRLTLTYIEEARQAGYSYSDIAVLTREKKDAQAVANELNRQQIPLVSADSLSLQFSDPIRFLVALLGLICRPGQRPLRYEVLYLFHTVVKFEVPTDIQTEAIRAIADSPDEASVFTYMANEGYAVDPTGLAQLNVYELTERLAHGFRLFGRTHDQPFLFRFLDEIMTFNNQQSGHLADFLTHWETARVKVAVSESIATEAITVQTIHKAKGLQFPVVIVPFADWGVDPNTRSTMWLNLDDVVAEPLRIPLPGGQSLRLPTAQVAVRRDLVNGPDAVVEQYRYEADNLFLENINLLYVAFTRPEDRLYVLAERAKPRANAKGDDDKAGAASGRRTVAQWLQQFLAESPDAATCGCVWDDSRSRYIWQQGQPKPPTEQKNELSESVEPIHLQGIISGSRGQNMQLRRQAERVFDTRTFERTRERERKLCAALSLIKGAGCVDKSLRQLVREGVIRAVETDELHRMLSAIVLHPDLADVFGYDRRIDTDRGILSKRPVQGAPHRVVHRPDGHIVLVQYGSPTEQTDTWLVTFVELYRQMGYDSVEGRVVWLGNEPTVTYL
ncbi:UvrD-helicase domain-containing protein [Fibrella sp. HMF5335]|uniref:DNA 3'-5' helicase n=1 Tax=Fibrella rubiginis TaxID=2817060 RepID=A0A939GKJ2_9BACT|nr:UvrD-helicase domain-containing protein [Fibrella rubiginis]MBO0938505.1 UvrD-helicase domain-containing protein [Fibrella rubiginis]